MPKVSCSDILAEIQNINAKNDALKKSINSQVFTLDSQRMQKEAQRNSIVVPSTVQSSYAPQWSPAFYGCDDARYFQHKTYCQNLGQGNMYEWTGEMQYAYGVCLNNLGGCCATIGACRPSQSYLNSMAQNAQSNINNLNSEIGSINAKIAALNQTALNPVPNIGCCQSVDLNNITGDVVMDTLTQTCNISNSGSNNSGSGSESNGMSAFTIFLIFVFILALGVAGGLIYYFGTKESFSSLDTNMPMKIDIGF